MKGTKFDRMSLRRVLLVLVCFCVFALIAVTALLNPNQKPSTHQTTQVIESANTLTILNAVYAFFWGGNMTRRYEEYLGATSQQSEPSDEPVTTALELSEIVPLSFSEDYFRIVACGNWTTRTRERQNPYVRPFVMAMSFRLEEGVWKLSGAFDFTDERVLRRGEWAYVPEWLKLELGDVPSLATTYNAATCL